MMRLGAAKLDAMVEEAIVDCYSEDEEATGLFTMLEESLTLPFETTVLGVAVTVKKVAQSGQGGIVAICTRDGIRQAIYILDLPLPTPPPAGSEWIAAYRHWVRAGSGL
jgi:calcium binding protein